MTGPPDGMTIATPGDWMVLDMHALAKRGAAKKLLDARLEELPLLAEHRDELIDLVGRSARAADELGVEFAAVLADLRDDGAPVLASVMLTTVDTPPVADEVGRAYDVSKAVAGQPDGEAHSSGPRQEATEVDLPAGRAARFERLHEQRILAGGPAVLSLSVQYCVPVPGAARVALLSFATPTIGYRGELVGLFHAIAGSLAFRWDEAADQAADLTAG